MENRIILPGQGENAGSDATQTQTPNAVLSVPMQAAAGIVADGFQSVSSAGKTVQNLDTDKLIRLDEYNEKKKAAKRPAKAIRKMRTSGGSPRE